MKHFIAYLFSNTLNLALIVIIGLFLLFSSVARAEESDASIVSACEITGDITLIAVQGRINKFTSDHVKNVVKFKYPQAPTSQVSTAVDFVFDMPSWGDDPNAPDIIDIPRKMMPICIKELMEKL